MENQEKNNKEVQSQKPHERVARFSAIIYLILAISVVVVATVGIFSISYDYDPELPTIDLSAPEPSSPPASAPSESPDEPVGGEQSNVGADIEEPAPEPKFFRPVIGEVIKGHSLDNLVFSETMGDYRVHSGLDISAPTGSEVVCYTDGVVISAEEDYFYGMTVSVKHDGGIVTWYKNLSNELAEGIKSGAEVSAGQVIGYIGDTARAEKADASHLHFEMMLDGEEIDPTEELPE